MTGAKAGVSMVDLARLHREGCVHPGSPRLHLSRCRATKADRILQVHGQIRAAPDVDRSLHGDSTEIKVFTWRSTMARQRK